MPTIVPIYAAIFALIYVALSINVIRGRFSGRVSLGTGNLDMLERRIRIHGNFSEYVPFALILLTLIEMAGQPHWLVHALCITMLTGRVSHVFGMTKGYSFRLRQAGMVLTFTVLIVSALALLKPAVGF